MPLTPKTSLVGANNAHWGRFFNGKMFLDEHFEIVID
jgi:hypothetical protein